MGQWISKRIPPPEDDPPSDQPQVLNDTLSTNDMMKQDVMAGLSLVPDAGSALDLLVSLFWPDSGSNTWDQIAAGVKAICAGLIQEQMVKDLADKTQGLYALMHDYRQTSYGITQKGEKLTFILGWFIENKPSYMNQTQPWVTLQYFVPMATLNLTALREQWLYWDKIYTNDQGASTAQHLNDLQSQMREYVKAANDIKTQCLTWRSGCVTQSNWEQFGLFGMGETCTVTDNVRGITHTLKRPNDSAWDPTVQAQRAQAAANANKYYQNLLDYVDQVYRQQIDDLMSPSLQWPYFDNTGSYPDIREKVRTTTGTMGSGLSQYMVHFNHRASRDQNGPITRIVLYGGDWISGIEVFYGNVSSGLQGKANDKMRTLDIGATEGIVKISGNVSDKLYAIQFIVSPSKWIGGGLHTDMSGVPSDPNFSMGDMPWDPLAFVGWKLDYLFGWGNPVDGRIEQFGAVLVHDEVAGIGVPSSTPAVHSVQAGNPNLGSAATVGAKDRHEGAKLKYLSSQAREQFLKERLVNEKMVK